MSAINASKHRENAYARAKSGLIEEDRFSANTPSGAQQLSENAISHQNDASRSISNIPDQLLSDRDVAGRYRVQKQTVWRWAKESKTFPKPFKIEGTTRWSRNELDEHDSKRKGERR